MKDCPRCGFLNPDRADYCMKCRFLMSGDPDATTRVGPAPSPGGGQAPAEDPGGGSASEEPRQGAGGSDEPPDWVAKPDLLPPAPDLDDTMDGRGFASGGYDIGGVTDAPQAGPAPGDAFAIMTGGSAMAPGADFGLRDGKGRSDRSKGRRGKGRASPRRGKGTLDGLPPAPDPSAAFTPAFAVDAVQAPFTPSHAPGDIFSPPAPSPADVHAPGRQPSLRKPLPRAARRPAPRQPAGARARWTGASATLSGLKALASPRYLLAAVGLAMILIAFVYLAAGGGYFARPGSKALGAAEAAMSKVSYHLDVDVLATTSTGASHTGKVAVDVTSGGDFHAVYAGDIPGLPPYREYIRSEGKTWELSESGVWGPSRAGLDFSPSAILGSASGTRLVDRQSVGGIESDHLSFHGATAFVASLFPASETTDITRAEIGVWLDPRQNRLVHLTADATGLEQREAGSFRCHVEATFSNFGAPLTIKPPV